MSTFQNLYSTFFPQKQKKEKMSNNSTYFHILITAMDNTKKYHCNDSREHPSGLIATKQYRELSWIAEPENFTKL